MASFVEDVAGPVDRPAAIRQRLVDLAQLGAPEVLATSQVTARITGRIADRGATSAALAGGLRELRGVVEDLDPPDPDRLDAYPDRYARSRERLDAVLGDLGEDLDALGLEIAERRQEERSLELEVASLRRYAVMAGRLDEALEARLGELADTDPSRARRLRDDVLAPVRSRHRDLLLHLQVATQSLLGLRALASHDETLREAVSLVRATTIAGPRRRGAGSPDARRAPPPRGVAAKPSTSCGDPGRRRRRPSRRWTAQSRDAGAAWVRLAHAYHRAMVNPSTVPTDGLVFACIAPHGDLAIPEACPPHLAALATATQAGMAELGRRFEATAPDIVVLLTPHGIHVGGQFAVVVAGRAAGSLAEAPAVALDLEVDRDLALAFVAALHAASLPVVGVSFGGNVPAEAVMPLDWGSLIPLWFLGGRRVPQVRVVIVAPARDRPIDEHVAAGSVIAQVIARSGRRVALVASADQAHAHAADGPYGYDPSARAHDELVVSLLREGRLGALRDLDPALVAAAKPDAWWQELMLLGAIGEAWTPRVVSYESPTYYGMLCAAFDPPG